MTQSWGEYLVAFIRRRYETIWSHLLILSATNFLTNTQCGTRTTSREADVVLLSHHCCCCCGCCQRTYHISHLQYLHQQALSIDSATRRIMQSLYLRLFRRDTYSTHQTTRHAISQNNPASKPSCKHQVSQDSYHSSTKALSVIFF